MAASLCRFFYCVALVVLLSCTQSQGARSVGRKCSMSRQKADVCSRTILSATVDVFGDRKHFEAINYNETDIYCNQIRRAVQCLEEYKWCLSTFARNLLKVYIRFVKKENRNFCHPEDKKLLLNHVACMDKKKVRAQSMHRCIDKFVLMLTHIRDDVEDKDQFPASCCAFEMFRQCTRTVAELVCVDITGSETATFFDGILIRVRKQIANLGCTGRYDSEARCRINAPNVTRWFEGIANGPDVGPQTGAPLLIFIDIATGHVRG